MRSRYVKRVLTGLGLTMMLAVSQARATDYYVVGPGASTPIPPYTNWATASTNLAAVAGNAGDGDTVYVTNNTTYTLTSQMTLSYSTTVRSWGADGALDPDTTILNANYPNTTNRHLVLNDAGATVAGFTLTKGSSTDGLGGSVLLYEGTLSDCNIISNYSFHRIVDARYGGGGVHIRSATGRTGAIRNCTIADNISSNYGGGIDIFSTPSSGGGGPFYITNCTIARNSAVITGGGIAADTPGGTDVFINNCSIVSNYAGWYAGGIKLDNRMECVNSIIMGNVADAWEGGGVNMNAGSLLRNCLIVRNVMNAAKGGAGIFSNGGSIQNCTISSNTCVGSVGGFYAKSGSSYVENTIIWGNKGWHEYPNWLCGASLTLTNSCTTPDRGFDLYGASAVNTVTNDPLFVYAATNNYRLKLSSDCVNAGIYRAWMAGATDLAGWHRAYPGEEVDIGCYENYPTGTIMLVY